MPTVNIDGAHVFPEDVGTDAPTDYEQPTSAGHYGGLIRHDELLNYVADGMSLNPDYGNNSLDVGSGTAFLLVDGVLVQGIRGGDFTDQWHSGIGVVVNAPEVQNITLSSRTLNHVFLAVDMNAGDGAYYEVNTTGEQPADPYVKIGEIDTDNEVVDPLPHNRSIGFASRDEFEQTQSEITSLEDRVTTAEGDISTLEGRVSTAEGDIDAVESDVTTLDDRVSTAEDDISDLQARNQVFIVNDTTSIPSEATENDLIGVRE